MLKTTRVAAVAAALLIAVATAATPLMALAQAQPPAPASPAEPAAATKAPTPAPTAPAGKVDAAKTTELIENPYGLEALWKGGDLVARITLGILVIMSIGSWYIIVTKVYE